MGTDVQLYVEVPPSHAHIPQWAIDKFDAHCSLGDYPRKPSLEYRDGYGKPEQVMDYSPSAIHVNTLYRYFGLSVNKAYAWPEILKGIRILQDMFPGYVVCYGGDSLGWSDPVTEERISELQAHYDAITNE